MTVGVARPAERRSRWQFSVRTVLLLMVAVAALSALYRVAPQLDVFVLGVSPTALSVHHGVRCWRRQRRVSLPVIATVLLSFGMFYVVAVGPAIALSRTGPFWNNVFDHIYAPLEWAYEQPIFHDPLDWYADFWRDLE